MIYCIHGNNPELCYDCEDGAAPVSVPPTKAKKVWKPRGPRKWAGIFCKVHPDRPARGLGKISNAPLCTVCYQDEYQASDEYRRSHRQSVAEWDERHPENVRQRQEKWSLAHPYYGSDYVEGEFRRKDFFPEEIERFRKMVAEGNEAMVPRSFLKTEKRRMKYEARREGVAKEVIWPQGETIKP
jgi:hypothetical protein